jgi:hypothetical protein
MAEPDLSRASLLVLIVALLDRRVGGSAGLPPSEPARAAAILAELRRRTGQDFGADPHAWCDWFLSEYPLEFADTRRRIQEIERRALRKLRR